MIFRGMKELLKMIEEGDVNCDDPDALLSLLQAALDTGAISQDTLINSAVLQKTLAASGSSPETVAKMIALQKTLAESGMPRHEVKFHVYSIDYDFC